MDAFDENLQKAKELAKEERRRRQIIKDDIKGCFDNNLPALLDEINVIATGLAIKAEYKAAKSEITRDGKDYFASILIYDPNNKTPEGNYRRVAIIRFVGDIELGQWRFHIDHFENENTENIKSLIATWSIFTEKPESELKNFIIESLKTKILKYIELSPRWT